jgi:NADH-quinone oxidoreductase subunit E
MSTVNQNTHSAHLIASDCDPSSVLTQIERDAIAEALHHYEDGRAAAIDALKIVQKQRGWVPDETIEPIARMIGISAVDLEGVATFYSLIFRQPVGRHVIKVCDSIGCFLTGYDELIAEFKKQLNIDYGQTTADNRFTLLPICCLGNCDKGPSIMIDDDTFGPVEISQVASLLERYS